MDEPHISFVGMTGRWTFCRHEAATGTVGSLTTSNLLLKTSRSMKGPRPTIYTCFVYPKAPQAA